MFLYLYAALMAVSNFSSFFALIPVSSYKQVRLGKTKIFEFSRRKQYSDC